MAGTRVDEETGNMNWTLDMMNGLMDYSRDSAAACNCIVFKGLQTAFLLETFYQLPKTEEIELGIISENGS